MLIGINGIEEIPRHMSRAHLHGAELMFIKTYTEYVVFGPYMASSYFISCGKPFIRVFGRKNTWSLEPGCFVYPTFAMVIPHLATTSAGLIAEKYAPPPLPHVSIVAWRFDNYQVATFSPFGGEILVISRLVSVPSTVEPSIYTAVNTKKPPPPVAFRPPTSFVLF